VLYKVRLCTRICRSGQLARDLSVRDTTGEGGGIVIVGFSESGDGFVVALAAVRR